MICQKSYATSHNLRGKESNKSNQTFFKKIIKTPTIIAAQFECFTTLHDDPLFAAPPDLNFFDEINIDDCRTMNPHENAPVKLLFDPVHRLAQKKFGIFRKIETHVIVLRFEPLQSLGLEKPDSLILFADITLSGSRSNKINLL